jgi:hypothetical protein
MTTTQETCMCECEECLTLRGTADEAGSGETVAAFEHDGSTYEIDHLGIGSASQWGEFAVYCDDEEVAEFTLAESVPRPGPRPAGLPVYADELVRLARRALSGWTGRDDPPSGLPPGPLPARLHSLPRALRPQLAASLSPAVRAASAVRCRKSARIWRSLSSYSAQIWSTAVFIPESMR